MSGPRWDIPNTWAWTIADSISQIIGGGTPTASNPENFTENGIPWITPADLTGYHQKYISRGKRDLTQQGYATSSASLMPAGTVLFSSRAPIGYCVISENEVSTNQGFKSFLPENGVFPEYLYYYLKSSVEYIDTLASGTTFREISGTKAQQISIPLPPTAEQQRIVAKIDALFARSSRAREALAAIPALIDRYRQAVLAAAFRGDLTADWREAQRPAAPKIVARNPIDGRAKDLPALPDAWEWRAVGDLADISGGLTKNQKRHQLPRKMPYLRVANVYANELRLDEIAEIGVTPGEAEKLRLKNGDLLIVEGNGSLDQIGRVALWTDEVAGCGHQNHIIRARPLPNIVPKFVLYWLLSPLGRNAIQAVASSSSGLHTLSISKVSGLPIPFCSPDEMQAVVERIEVQLSALDKGGAEYYRASALIDRLDQSILDKAFSGRLVPQDPADEPAAQLLERIRAARAAARNPKRGRRARG